MLSTAPFPYSHKNPIGTLVVGARLTCLGWASTVLGRLGDLPVPDGYEDESGFHFGRIPVGSGLPEDGPRWMGENI